MRYYRGLPPSETPDATLTEIAGREADTVSRPGSCRAEFSQRRFVDLRNRNRADQVQVTLFGPEPEAVLCRRATALATAVAPSSPRPPDSWPAMIASPGSGLYSPQHGCGGDR